MEKVKLYIAICEARSRPNCPVEALMAIVDAIIENIKADGIFCDDGILNEYKRLSTDGPHPFDCKCSIHN